VRDTEDHSFQHYVDYKGIGAYESHWSARLYIRKQRVVLHACYIIY
jgi:hypothetical protein